MDHNKKLESALIHFDSDAILIPKSDENGTKIENYSLISFRNLNAIFEIKY